MTMYAPLAITVDARISIDYTALAEANITEPNATVSQTKDAIAKIVNNKTRTLSKEYVANALRVSNIRGLGNVLGVLLNGDSEPLTALSFSTTRDDIHIEI